MTRIRYSIRKRILFGLFIALILIMGTANLVSYSVAIHETDEIFSARLATSARVLDSLITQQIDHATISSPFVIHQPSVLTQNGHENSDALGHPYEAKLAFQVWSQDHKLLVRSASAPEERLGPLQPGFQDRMIQNRLWHVFTLKSGRVWIEVAEEAGVRDEIASDVSFVLSSPLVLGSTILLLVVNLIVIAGFRPLDKLTEKLHQRSPDDHSPLILHQVPTEITPLVEALNQLFERVAHMLTRERRFTDSAAHELRTPLAALKLHAQNLAISDNEEDQAVSLAQLLTSVQRTQQLVERMLTYSRLSTHSDPEEPCWLNAQLELEYAINLQQELLEGQSLRIEYQNTAKHTTIQAPKIQLDMLLRNLFENACKYTLDPNRAVRIELSNPNEQTLQIHIKNHAALLPHSELERLFEPYYRIPNQKSRGNGLGLAIVYEIAQQQHWAIALYQESDAFVAELTIPISPTTSH